MASKVYAPAEGTGAGAVDRARAWHGGWSRPLPITSPRKHRKGEGAPGRLLLPRLIIALMFCLFPLLTAGCGSQAARYAREARAAYISARAVLVGVKEFPSRMELLMRKLDPAALVPEARACIEEARNLVNESYAAFNAAQDKIALLEEEKDERFAPYGQKLSSLVALNIEVINAYAEYVGFCNSVLEGIPYQDKPQNLMPTLSGMDRAIKRAQELTSEIERQEEEAEALYRKLAG
mgnify:CR=1 FL=1